MTTATPDAKAKIVISALTVGAFAIGLDTFVIIGALDILASDLGISSGMAGWIISIYALAYAIFAPLNAWLFRDMSRRNVQVFSVSLFLIGNLICALAPSFWTLAAGRLVSAFGAAMFTPAATALATELLPPERKGLALSLIFGGMTVSQVAGVPATSWIAEAFGWRYGFGFVVLAGLLALAILTPMLSGIPARTPAAVEGGADRSFSRVVYGVLCVTFFVVVSEFIVYSYVSLFISGTLLPGVPLLSAALFAYGAGAVTGNVACGVLTDRLGPYRVLLTSVIAQVALLVALIAFGQHGILTVVIAFLWGNVSYMYLVPIQHRLLGLAGDRSKLVLAMNSSTIHAGIGTGAFIGGWLVEENGAGGLALASIIIGAAGIALALSFMRDSQAKQSFEVM